MVTIPKPTKKRLILLQNVLENWQKQRITSIEIGKLLGCKDTLVRFDLKFVECVPGVSNGYFVEELKDAVKKVLSCSEEKESFKKCCVVGLGRLGEALLDDGIFYDSGFKIVAGFDSNVNKVELLRSTFELFPASRIETVCSQQKIEYAFLCCAESESGKMVQRLVRAGIKGIVNYTRSVFEVPENVKVENVSPVMALQIISK